MAKEEDAEEAVRDVFDTSKSTVNYTRTKDTKTVTIRLRDPDGISEMKMYLILSLELEMLERRLGISEANDGNH